ncbi:Probable LRR receptor-like serine/threonine-protein kinase At3g47570, partial [Linum perenne]
DFDFLTSLTNCSLLEEIGFNPIKGDIPDGLENLVNLFEMELSNNLFTGSFPTYIGKFKDLQGLWMQRNILTGQIPSSIGNLTKLNLLDISNNRLQRAIPLSLGNCQQLNQLDVSANKLTGEIPGEVFRLSSLSVALNLSRNLFNEFHRKNQNFEAMQHLNLSYIDLQGEVQSKGIFRNASGMSLMGNSRLCGGISDLHLRDCPTEATPKQKRATTIKLTLIIVLVSLSFLSLVGLLYYFKVRSSKKQTSVADSALTHYMMVSYKDLHQATNGFSSDNLIGSGGFGTIYKGVLDQVANPVAVKVLNIHEKKAYKCLLAECNALKCARHRNLVRILT